MAEFAFAVAVLQILLTGVLDPCRMHMAWVAIQDTAGEGALCAATNPRRISAANGPDCRTPNNAHDRTFIAIRPTRGTPWIPTGQQL
ncbi:MAG: pilus assembly protein [Thermoflexus sp.]|nr:pilus assembly protein [Thermoflexus sp.]